MTLPLHNKMAHCFMCHLHGSHGMLTCRWSERPQSRSPVVLKRTVADTSTTASQVRHPARDIAICQLVTVEICRNTIQRLSVQVWYECLVAILKVLQRTLTKWLERASEIQNVQMMMMVTTTSSKYINVVNCECCCYVKSGKSSLFMR